RLVMQAHRAMRHEEREIDALDALSLVTEDRAGRGMRDEDRSRRRHDWRTKAGESAAVENRLLDFERRVVGNLDVRLIPAPTGTDDFPGGKRDRVPRQVAHDG